MSDPVTPDGRAREWLIQKCGLRGTYYFNPVYINGQAHSVTELMDEFAAHCSAEDAQLIEWLLQIICEERKHTGRRPCQFCRETLGGPR